MTENKKPDFSHSPAIQDILSEMTGRKSYPFKLREQKYTVRCIVVAGATESFQFGVIKNAFRGTNIKFKDFIYPTPHVMIDEWKVGNMQILVMPVPLIILAGHKIDLPTATEGQLISFKFRNAGIEDQLIHFELCGIEVER